MSQFWQKKQVPTEFEQLGFVVSSMGVAIAINVQSLYNKSLVYKETNFQKLLISSMKKIYIGKTSWISFTCLKLEYTEIFFNSSKKCPNFSQIMYCGN